MNKYWFIYTVGACLISILLIIVLAIVNVDSGKIDLIEIEKNYNSWMQKKPKNYLYKVEAGCRILDKAEVYVINGKREVFSESDFKRFSIDDFFKSLNDDYPRIHKLEAEFDLEYNFPKTVWIDHSADRLHDECLTKISGFKVIN